ncbi:ABC transporter ATP-binding protein [Gluconacetobacter tumulisoli]|uniref:ABC transporter ATP-binding protein n=1 Tax=Gluconacetobacter tumulisoli TaxID=1286189 RepID=A0A7W4K602_9PROT|nr:ABC transporter ATP-binding protein [Gluconacetobacter tumulisoli]MBB2200835.1 ABC transporter ATP-binding protein [Gluconacetobacter tumulisoli]
MNTVVQVTQEVPAPARDDAAVVVHGLTRRFGDGPAVLDRLDLAIAPGEFVALLGHSGSGKSTLLRTLAGLDPVTEGSVVRPREVSVVFQESRLLPWKRVWQNTVLGQDGADRRDRAVAVLEEVGLGHRVDAWPLTLSGGEAQRAALARALVREPAFLMLDEPFAALDALTRLKMQRLVSDLWIRHRCAVLLVTHDVDEALLLADRAVVLERGRIRTDVPIPMDRPRRHADPRFEHLRGILLESLGVHDG